MNANDYQQQAARTLLMEPDTYQAMALKTWYEPDNPLYLDPRHPLIKLAGEAGEILDLFGKHEYKPGFDWMDCKHCQKSRNGHIGGLICYHDRSLTYTPKVLDELGDWWYYLRIVTYQQRVNVTDWIAPAAPLHDISLGLTEINLRCAQLLSEYLIHDTINLAHLHNAFNWFCAVLVSLDCTLDHLTELNYAKLNSEPTAHGWKDSQRRVDTKTEV